MARKKTQRVQCSRVELDGVRYVILRESAFQEVCGLARVKPEEAARGDTDFATGLGLDQQSLAEKLVQRRRGVGLSQAELARRAGIRPETLNRIERGKTMPDFTTIRKLVVAIQAAERRQLDH